MAPRTLGFAIQPRKFTKVSWTGSYNQTLSVAQNSFTVLFRANSIYDPDYTNVSKNTSVNGYYLSSVIYQRYRVYGVKADYIIYNNSVTIGQAALVGGNETSQYATSAYVTDIAARNGVKSKILPPGSGNKPVYMSKYFNCCDLTGDTKLDYKTNPANSSAIGTNPTNPAYVGLTIGMLPEIATQSIVTTIRLRLTYFVELYDIFDNIGSI